ncbi:glycosyltransferase [Synechococcus sp. CBW1107]|uniref:glycosyltransferase n=1 Tax=Synechococcus sp. CBW1107 TaxID=2789857 RepID=UPI002AD5AA57|nr:glycosyltransferase [Synechococcus sp. CBW1107]CAK6687508.1 hypothetical protein MNNICLKF_00231 [Synechococcus sp. CBW1107]
MINLTICTVTLNNDSELLKTLSSIENQAIKPDLVVIKDGVKRSPPSFIEEYSFLIRYLSTADTGIYDAMNQALKASNDSYLLFLNSGDVLNSPNSIKHLHSSILSLNYPDLLFTSWSHQNQPFWFTPSLYPLYFSHQSVVYQKRLHHDLGPYITIKNFHSADYFFFMRALSSSSSYTCQLAPSICLSSIDNYGTSNSLKTRMFVSCIRFIAGQENRYTVAFYAIFHPLLYYFRSAILKSLLCLRLWKK